MVDVESDVGVVGGGGRGADAFVAVRVRNLAYLPRIPVDARRDRRSHG